MSPALIETIGSIAATLAGSSLVAVLAARIKRAISAGERTVLLTLASGREVRLDLDKRLSQEETSDLVAAAIRSAEAGDETELRRVVDASHAASQQMRATAAA